MNRVQAASPSRHRPLLGMAVQGRALRHYAAAADRGLRNDDGTGVINDRSGWWPWQLDLVLLASGRTHRAGMPQELPSQPA